MYQFHPICILVTPARVALATWMILTGRTQPSSFIVLVSLWNHLYTAICFISFQFPFHVASWHTLYCDDMQMAYNWRIFSNSYWQNEKSHIFKILLGFIRLPSYIGKEFKGKTMHLQNMSVIRKRRKPCRWGSWFWSSQKPWGFTASSWVLLGSPAKHDELYLTSLELIVETLYIYIYLLDIYIYIYAHTAYCTVSMGTVFFRQIANSQWEKRRC